MCASGAGGALRWGRALTTHLVAPHRVRDHLRAVAAIALVAEAVAVAEKANWKALEGNVRQCKAMQGNAR